MDIGTATLTPIDTYQIWFDNLQETGTIIAHNVSNAATVTFSGGTTNQVISFNAAGTWQNGPLAQTFDLGAAGDGQAGDPIIVTVLATFSYALTVGAVTYLAKKFLNKFSPNLQCTGFQLQHGNTQLSAQFASKQNRCDPGQPWWRQIRECCRHGAQKLPGGRPDGPGERDLDAERRELVRVPLIALAFRRPFGLHPLARFRQGMQITPTGSSQSSAERAPDGGNQEKREAADGQDGGKGRLGRRQRLRWFSAK